MFVFIKALDQIMNDLPFNYCRKSTTVLRLGQSHFVLSELLEFLCCVGQHLPSRELIINLVATTEVRLVSFHIWGCIFSGSELCCLLSTFNETTDAFLKKDDPSSTCAIVKSNLFASQICTRHSTDTLMLLLFAAVAPSTTPTSSSCAFNIVHLANI